MGLHNTQYAIRNTQHTHSALSTQHSALRTWARVHSVALFSLLGIAALYVAALVAVPPEGLTHHDTGAKYMQVRNLRLTPSGLDWSINYPARSLDPDLEFVPFNPKQYEADGQGRIYLQWPIFLGLLTRIPWKVMGFWGLYSVPLLAGLGTLWASYLLALRVGLPRRIAWLAIPLVGIATPISLYSLLFFEHTLAAMLVTGSLLAMVIAQTTDDRRRTIDDGRTNLQTSRLASSISYLSAVIRRPSSSIALSAALLAFAVYFRSELYILAFVMVSLYAWDALRHRTWRPLLQWLGAFLLALVPLWAFYAINEGNILPLHATWYFAGSDGSSVPTSGGIELPRLRYITQAGLGIVPDFLMGPQDPQKAPLSPTFPLWHQIATLSGVALCVLAALARLLQRPLPPQLPLYALASGLALILVPTAFTLFSSQPYYNLHGFLLASPFITLSLVQSPKSKVQSLIPSSVDELANSRLSSVVLLYVTLHTLIISALSGLGTISRNEWGQRYLLPAYPALAVLALLAGWRIWVEYSANLRRFAIACVSLGGLLAAVGIGFTVRGYFTLADQRGQVIAWQALARTLPAREPLLTDTWWLPLNLAADFYTRPIMLAKGDERIAKWVAQMRVKNVASFGFISPDRATLTGVWSQTAGVIPDGSSQEARGMWLQRYIFSK